MPIPQSLVTYSSPARRGSFVANATRLPASRSRGDRLDRAGHGLVAHPDAAVEVEDQLVVALDERGEGQA